MGYSEDIKQKIKNIYFNRIIIGVKNLDPNLFEFLNDFNFTPNEYQNQYVSDISSENFDSILSLLEKNPKLKNTLGIEFESSLLQIRKNNRLLVDFFSNTNISMYQIKNTQDTIKINEKAELIASKFGLKECYYVYNKKDSEKGNFIDAMLTLNNLEHDLEKIQKMFHIKNSYDVGSNILGVEIDIKKGNNYGQFNCLNNNLLLHSKDNLPTIHEYIHFIDKTTASLLLTRKTTKQLYEDKKYSDEEIAFIFNMDNFLKVKKNNLFDISTLIFQKRFKKEIEQNKKIEDYFNEYLSDDKNKYINIFQQEIYKWIYKQDFLNKAEIFQEVKHILHGNQPEEFNNSNEQIEKLYIYCYWFKQNQEYKNVNNYMLFANILDKIKERNSKKYIANTEYELKDNERHDYFQSQREMLARSIEILENKNIKDLSHILTTPKQDISKNKEILNIVKSWKDLINSILLEEQHIKANDKINDFLNKFRNNNKQIQKIRKNMLT